MKVYEIAVDRREAESLAADGYGYSTHKGAETALASPEIDDFYRGKLHIFECEVPDV